MRTIIIDDDKTGNFQVITISTIIVVIIIIIIIVVVVVVIIIIIIIIIITVIIIIADSEDFASGRSERGDITMQFVTSDSTFCNS